MQKNKEIKKTLLFRERGGNAIFTWADVCRNRLSFSVTSLLSGLFQLQQNNLLNYVSMTFNANDAVL